MSKDLKKLMESADQAVNNEDFAQAETMYQAALWEAERTNDPSTIANCLDRLAEVLFDQGKYVESEPIYKRALEIREQQLGPHNEEIVQSLNNLSAVYFFQEKFELAEPLCVRLTEIYERVLGNDNPEVATSYNNLALLYTAQKKYHPAESLYKRSLELKTNLYGDKHPEVGDILQNLGTLYFNQERYADAETLLKQSLSILENALGEGHADLEILLVNLAQVLEHNGKYLDSSKIYEKILSIKEIQLGPTHPEIIQMLKLVSKSYARRAKYDEAERFLKRALTIWERSQGKSSPQGADLYSLLGELNQEQKKISQAENYYRDALAAAQTAMGANHVETIEKQKQLADFYLTFNRPAKAQPHLEKIVELQGKASISNPDLDGGNLARADLAECLFAQQKFGEAKKIFEDIKEYYDQKAQKDSEAFGCSLHYLAELERKEKKFDMAEVLFKRAIDVRTRVLGAQHLDVGKSLQAYADLLTETYREGEAEHLKACAKAIFDTNK
ncbi:tetratricopeptide repeat protein [bacterium]|nr:tetratricopeptide repeat protein [bacterium]QQR56589.1 MAG: tetratricopeptide repeat protein [Candidatus Melainabacteria bacterium]